MNITVPVYPFTAVPNHTVSTWQPDGSYLWNGPICPVCSKGYLGICKADHRPYLPTGYVGRHR